MGYRRFGCQKNKLLDEAQLFFQHIITLSHYVSSPCASKNANYIQSNFVGSKHLFSVVNTMSPPLLEHGWHTVYSGSHIYDQFLWCIIRWLPSTARDLDLTVETFKNIDHENLFATNSSWPCQRQRENPRRWNGGVLVRQPVTELKHFFFPQVLFWHCMTHRVFSNIFWPFQISSICSSDFHLLLPLLIVMWTGTVAEQVIDYTWHSAMQQYSPVNNAFTGFVVPR